MARMKFAPGGPGRIRTPWGGGPAMDLAFDQAPPKNFSMRRMLATRTSISSGVL